MEKVRSQPDFYIRERKWWERLLNIPPADLHNGDGNRIIMFKDKWGSFIKKFLMGMDFDFLMLDTLIITFMERETQRHPDVTSRVALAIMMSYTVDHILFWIMGYRGRRNLSKHTLTDEAFLI